MDRRVADKLEQLRGTFENGHADDDVTAAFKQINKLLGLHLAVVWKFCDMHGISGDSDMAVVMLDGTMTEAPEIIRLFLYDGLGDSAELAKPNNQFIIGPVMFDGKKPVRMSKHNYVWEVDTSKEWDDMEGFDLGEE